MDTQVDRVCWTWTAIILLLTFLSTESCAEQPQSFGRRPTTFNIEESTNNDNSSKTGWFLNTNAKANYNGSVSAWTFCYYSEGLINQTNITVAVWRPTNDMETVYEMVEDSTGTIMIQPPNSNALYDTDFICQKWMLNENIEFSVMMGDMVGACFDESASVHFLGREEDGSGRNDVEHFTVINDTFIDKSNMSFDGYGLYLEAIIGTTNSSTYSISPTPTHTPTPTPTPTLTPTPTSTSGLDGWEIPVAAIALLLLVVTVIITFFFLILCYKYRKLRKMAPMATNTSYTAELRDVSEPPTVVLERYTSIDMDNGFLFNNNSSSQLMISNRSNLSPSFSNQSPVPSHHSNETVPVLTAAGHEEFTYGDPTYAVASVIGTENQDIDGTQELSRIPTKEKPLPFPFALAPSGGKIKQNIKRSKSDMGCKTPHETPYYEKVRSVSEEKRVDDLCESTESNYPYVLHSREALGHTPLAAARSLPNIFQGENPDEIYAEPDFGRSPTTLSYLQPTPVYSYPDLYEFPFLWQRLSHSTENMLSESTQAKRRSLQRHNHFGSVPDLTPTQKASFFIPSVTSQDSIKSANRSSASRVDRANCESFIATGTSQSHSRLTSTCSKGPPPPHCQSSSSIVSTSSKFSRKCTPPPTKPKPCPRKKCNNFKPHALPSKIPEDLEELTEESAVSKPAPSSEQLEPTPQPYLTEHIYDNNFHTQAIDNRDPLSPLNSLKSHSYMKLQQDKMEDYIALYQHLLHGDEHNFAAVMDMEENDMEKSPNTIDSETNRIHPKRHEESQAQTTYDAFFEVSGEHEYETTDEYLESVSDFIGTTALS